MGLARCRGEARGEPMGVGGQEQLCLATPIILVVPVPLCLALIILNLHIGAGQLQGKC